MDRRARRHCRRLASAFDTDRVQRALSRARVHPLSAAVVQGRLRRTGRTGDPLVRPEEGTAAAAMVRRVLQAAAAVYPREVRTILPYLLPQRSDP